MGKHIMAGVSFQYFEDDSEGYELLICSADSEVVVDGALHDNNALGDLMRAATAFATGARHVETWHGSYAHLLCVRYALVRPGISLWSEDYRPRCGLEARTA